MSWLESLPNYTAYGTPSYFIYLLIAVLPMGISLYFGKRLAWYEPSNIKKINRKLTMASYQASRLPKYRLIPIGKTAISR